MKQEFKDIPDSKNWIKISKIEKGWSIDSKYYIENKNGEKFLLRISPIKYYETKLNEFNILSLLNIKNISKPFAFGKCNNDNFVYMIFTWIDGKDAKDNINNFTNIEQYNLGYKSGKILKKIHNLSVENFRETWNERFFKKIDRNIKNYRACGCVINGFNNIIDYIIDNKYLLNGRIQTAQHGDYHIGNMLITPKDEIAIIDFNRFDVGDPWEEFNRITWCADKSAYFATGRINGYFDEKIPENFFKLLALYIGSNQLSSIPWSMKYGEKDLNIMKIQVKKILKSYNFFSKYIPDWYLGTNETNF